MNLLSILSTALYQKQIFRFLSFNSDVLLCLCRLNTLIKLFPLKATGDTRNFVSCTFFSLLNHLYDQIPQQSRSDY